MSKVNITKSFIKSLPFERSGQKIYWDATLQGFGVRVTTKKMTFVAQRKVKGKDIRVTVGLCDLTIPGSLINARKKAEKLLTKMSSGINPNEEKQDERARKATLDEALEDFFVARKGMKPSTVNNMRYVMGRYFDDWMEKPVSEITKEMVRRRHEKTGESDAGAAQANLSMRYLRAVINYAISKYADSRGASTITENPVKILSSERSWYPVGRKRTVVKYHQLPALFDALDELKAEGVTPKGETAHDFILFLIFTGLRRREASTLKWSDVDFKEKSFTVIDTKNGNPLSLPLSDYIINLLQTRYENRTNEYIFPGGGKAGHLVEPGHYLLKVREKSGLTCTFHDMRRTFITIADDLDVSAFSIKMLVNHSIGSDVTAGYIVSDVERLRTPMQKITDKILFEAGRHGRGAIPKALIAVKKDTADRVEKVFGCLGKTIDTDVFVRRLRAEK